VDDSDPIIPRSVRSGGQPGWRILGIVLIVIGTVLGGSWTFAVFIGESLILGEGQNAANFGYFGTVLTAVATSTLVAAGVVLIVGSSRSAAAGVSNMLVSTGVFLILAAIAAYIFGIAVCLPKTC
jgi:hypothetical protein